MKTHYKISSLALIVGALALLAVSCSHDGEASTPALSGGYQPYLTSQEPFITLDNGVAAGSSVTAIINSGDGLGDFRFQGLPDGIGIAPASDGNVNVFVAHEETTIPFRDVADLQDSSVSKLTLDKDTAAVLGAEVAIPATAGFVRFCSGSVAGPEAGFSNYVYFANEESNDILDVPPNAPYNNDPGLEIGKRQAGYTVAFNAETNTYTQIAGLGRLNHENTVAIPGYSQLVLVTTDDTFSAPSAQLYMYVADDEDAFWADQGSLWAFRATHDNDGAVDATNPQNGANDYLDLAPGQAFQGEFIQVPRNIARGITDEAPQTSLENWSNENNIFQFIRLEDITYDKNNPNVLYIADTGSSRVIPNPETGRLQRGESGTVGSADRGSVFTMVLDTNNPLKVTSLSVFAQGDNPDADNYVAMRGPDNLGSSENSLMVQEDTSAAKIWRHDFSSGQWSVVATVNDEGGESSGIVDASEWFGSGSWLLSVQATANIQEVMQGDTTQKLSSGQVMLLRIPGS